LRIELGAFVAQRLEPVLSRLSGHETCSESRLGE